MGLVRAGRRKGIGRGRKGTGSGMIIGEGSGYLLIVDWRGGMVLHRGTMIDNVAGQSATTGSESI